MTTEQFVSRHAALCWKILYGSRLENAQFIAFARNHELALRRCAADWEIYTRQKFGFPGSFAYFSRIEGGCVERVSVGLGGVYWLVPVALHCRKQENNDE